MLGFYGLLRTGELLGLRNSHMAMSGPSSPAVVNLGLTKGGVRQGAVEGVSIGDIPVLRFVWRWKALYEPHSPLVTKAHVWRQRFQECLPKLGLHDLGLRPYSLRRGGATFFGFPNMGISTSCSNKVVGQLHAQLAFISMRVWQLLVPFLGVFKNSAFQPTLERPQRRRPGGRGKKRKRGCLGVDSFWIFWRSRPRLTSVWRSQVLELAFLY